MAVIFVFGWQDPSFPPMDFGKSLGRSYPKRASMHILMCPECGIQK